MNGPTKSDLEREALGLLLECLEVINRDKLQNHFTDDWRFRAEELIYPLDADEKSPTVKEIAREMAMVAPPVNDKVN